MRSGVPVEYSLKDPSTIPRHPRRKTVGWLSKASGTMRAGLGVGSGREGEGRWEDLAEELNTLSLSALRHFLR